MPATSSGKAKRPPAAKKKKKSGTVSHKLHTFESFNDRIAKLHIDPVRRARGRDEVDAQDTDAATSHFRRRLDTWKDLNLSESFGVFVREVDPLCDSLAQLVHYQDRIVAILLEHLRAGNALALEPLLDLVAALAHDLGTRFESYFAETLGVIRDLVIKQPDVEVLEWCFAALSWMFKYLSRLLVPDLRPTFDVMATLLGRTQQKAHIARFAAEAMAFLVRKAAATHGRNQAPLDLLLQHVFEELKHLEIDDSALDTYEYGLMSLFAASMKGVDQGLHSSAISMFGPLLRHVVDPAGARVATGTFVNLLHHCSADTAAPLLKAVQDYAGFTFNNSGNIHVQLVTDLIFHASTLREGSRVAKWDPLVQSMNLVRKSYPESSICTAVARAYMALLARAPLQAILSEIRPFLEVLLRDEYANVALPALAFFHELNPDRFDQFCGSYLQRVISSRYTSRGDEILCLLLRISKDHTTKATNTLSKEGIFPQVFLSSIFRPDQGDLFSDVQLSRQSACLDMPMVDSMNEVGDSVCSRLQILLDNGEADPHESRMLIGSGLRSLLRSRRGQLPSNINQIWQLLEQFSGMPMFLDNLTTLVEEAKLDLSSPHSEQVESVLTHNLRCPSKKLRKSSLQLLKRVDQSESDIGSRVADLMLSMEDVSADLQAGRKLAMFASQLASLYDSIPPTSWTFAGVPNYLFGLLTHPLTEVWPAAIDVLKTVCNNKQGEKVVFPLALGWLEAPIAENDILPKLKSLSTADQGALVNNFQCTRSEDIKRDFATVTEKLSCPVKRLRDAFDDTHRKEPHTFVNSRAQALRVFKAIPWLAEKHSRQLIPIFLGWSSEGRDEENEGAKAKFSRPEWITMLDMFGLFQNPRALYKSQEVYEVLLDMLSWSEVEIQKRALKAILTWKHPSILQHEESFTIILDEARFRDGVLDIAYSLQNETLKPEDRQQAMSILLRIFFGRITASSKYSEKSSQQSKRHAVFDVLARFKDVDLREFLQIALGSISMAALENLDSTLAGKLLDLTPRKTFGLLNVIKEMTRFFGNRLAFMVKPIANIAVACSEQVSSELPRDDNDDIQQQRQTSLLRSIQHTSLQILIMLFERLMSEPLADLVPKIYLNFVNHRIDRLPEENSQSVSALLKLFAAWSSDEQMKPFLTFAPRLLNKIGDILTLPAAKDEVKQFVLDNILLPLFHVPEVDATDAMIPDHGFLVGYYEHVLQCCYELLQDDPSKPILLSTIELVTSLASQSSESAQARNLLRISCNLLDQPPSRVSPKMKGDILSILQQLIAKTDLSIGDDLFEHIVHTISYLFGYFKDRDNRLKLCDILELLSEKDSDLAVVSPYCTDLNSFSTITVDEPDFDRRRRAYETIIGLEQGPLSARQWDPIIHNLLFFLKETDELGVGSNACFALCAFAKQAKMDPMLLEVIRSTILPALQKGAHEQSEDVRREYLKVMATLVDELPEFEPVSDLSGLLMGNDDEASIFNNLLHIQQHRRVRALRRLASPQICGPLQSMNVANFLVPMIEHFVLDREDETKNPELASETIVAIGALASSMEWKQVRRLFLKYQRFMKSKNNLERSTTRLLGALVDAIVLAAQKKGGQAERPQEHQSVMDTEKEEGIDGLVPNDRLCMLAESLAEANLEEEIVQALLPPLYEFLRHRDEAVVSLRVPVAVPSAKLIMLLPPDKLSARLPPLLTDVCHILRSRTPESRDLCRKTLAEITRVVGASYFGFILKELRGALQQGYQLHVLSYTMHTLLVEGGPSFSVGSLDHCAASAVAVIMDDIFGVVGSEKDSEDYTSKMKEVKQSKSFDSMELLAKVVSIDRFSTLVRPIQTLLQERIDLKATKKVDELLRRITAGLLKNTLVEDRRVLIFCYELVQRAYTTDPRSTAKDQDAITRRFMVDVRGAKANRGAAGPHFGFKIVKFAFDLLRSVLQKFESLRTPANISGFMSAIGDAILQGEDEVQMSALRLLASIMKVPLKALDTDAPAYIAAAVDVVKNTSTNESEMSQAALKLIASALRERPTIEIREEDVAYLLKRLRPDLDRTENQGFVFNLLKSVMGRQIIIPEVYEMMDSIAAMMITSHSQQTRNMAQASFFQFILNYPQGSKRFTKQLGFLRKNLDYPHVEGRKSVLEAIHRLLSRVSGELLQEVIDSFFEPLVLTIVNDEDADCRKMAGLLIGTCFETAEATQLARISDQLKAWLTQDQNTLLVRAAFQLYAIWIDKRASKVEKILPALCTRIEGVLESSIAQQSNEDWEVLYSALQLLSKLVEHFPEKVFTAGHQRIWNAVQRCIAYPHVWIKHLSANILGEYLVCFSSSPKTASFPLVSPNGLEISSDDIRRLTQRGLKSLLAPNITVELAGQTIRNLSSLAKLSQLESLGENATSGLLSNSEASDEDSNDENNGPYPVLENIFRRLSWIIRKEPATSQAASLIPKTASLQLCRALCTDLDPVALKALLPIILLPIRHLTDPGITTPFSLDENFKTAWKEAVAIGHEIIDILQNRVGSADYLKHMSAVQASVKAKREERRTKRRIEAVAAPEKAALEKRRKHDRQKERRKEKTSMYRERRRGM